MDFSATVPPDLSSDPRIAMRLDGPSASDGFMRVDIYPRIAPKQGRRHYGYWDAPFALFEAGRADLRLDFPHASVGDAPLANHVSTPFFEHGYVDVHVSCWTGNAAAPVLVGVRSYQSLILDGNGDVALKQVAAPSSDACNLECIGCPRNTWSDKTEDHAPRAVIDAILAAAEQLECIQFGGLGEPFLNKRLYDDLKDAKSALPEGGTVGVITNGTVLNAVNAARIADSDLDYIFFSLDGVSAETNRITRPGLNFERTVAAIRDFVPMLRAQRPNAAVTFNFVVQEANWREIADYARLCIGLGANSVAFSWYLDTVSSTFRLIDNPEIRDLFEQALALGREAGVAVHVPSFVRREGHPCFYMQQAIVWTDGDVYPCCNLLPGYSVDRPEVKFGNVLEQPLLDIWASPDYRRFRTDVLQQNWPAACVGCDYRSGVVI